MSNIIKPRDVWFVTNVTNKTLIITDIPSIPKLTTGLRIDLLLYASKSALNNSTTLSNYVNQGWIIVEDYLHTHDDKSNVGHTHVLKEITDIVATSEQLNKAGVFFSGTNITSSQANLLISGENADSLHIHSSSGGASIHNDLEEIQGGEKDEYYHLTENEYLGLVDGDNADSLHSHIIDHDNLLNQGENSHTIIDSHISNSLIHFTQSQISITESQISNLDKYTKDEVDDLIDGVGGDYLNKDGSNADTTINIGSQDLTTTGLGTFGSISCIDIESESIVTNTVASSSYTDDRGEASISFNGVHWEISQGLEVNGSINILSYSSKLYLGENQESNIYFDGTDLNIDLDNPSIGGVIKLNDDVEVLGQLSVDTEVGTIVLSTGSIIDSSGKINFGTAELETTGKILGGIDSQFGKSDSYFKIDYVNYLGIIDIPRLSPTTGITNIGIFYGGLFIQPMTGQGSTLSLFNNEITKSFSFTHNISTDDLDLTNVGGTDPTFNLNGISLSVGGDINCDDITISDEIRSDAATNVPVSLFADRVGDGTSVGSGYLTGIGVSFFKNANTYIGHNNSGNSNPSIAIYGAGASGQRYASIGVDDYSRLVFAGNVESTVFANKLSIAARYGIVDSNSRFWLNPTGTSNWGDGSTGMYMNWQVGGVSRYALLTGGVHFTSNNTDWALTNRYDDPHIFIHAHGDTASGGKYLVLSYDGSYGNIATGDGSLYLSPNDGNIITSGNLSILSYSSKLYLGENQESNIYFDGTDLNIDLDNPSIGGVIKLNDDVDILGDITVEGNINNDEFIRRGYLLGI